MHLLLVCGYGDRKEGKNRGSEISLIQACSGSNKERHFPFGNFLIADRQPGVEPIPGL